MTQHGRPATTVRVTRLVHRGLTVRISTLGSPDGRAFVLVPGIGVSSDYFERLAPRLDGHGTVHALDLPGFAGVRHPGGRSRSASTPTSWAPRSTSSASTTLCWSATPWARRWWRISRPGAPGSARSS
ncbi:hypothetical protein BC477_07100 [Clavibacter michiganensis subsp. michiganensis]|uniref:Alpha/beta hydrolase family protein n=1 Tax=Clavibacter michiganensis subsp. michiganensis TaxID=33013 RepID=A0A251XLX3_CLAMM|nr:hypothetical protein BC477_07100 [Clavibacter michiganensis subsp. michiganensis]OUE04484.1 hypothetical protein CMMCAS07_06030 [Clavibacter michiganensis subsp. michiganensis]